MKTVQRYERHSRLGQSWESLPERVRQHLLDCDEQLVAVLRDDPHAAHLGPSWPLLKGHFVALIRSGTRQVCNELWKQGKNVDGK